MAKTSQFVEKVKRSDDPVAATNVARTIAFEQIAQQVVKLVRAALAETDYDHYHYLQDLYYDASAGSARLRALLRPFAKPKMIR